MTGILSFIKRKILRINRERWNYQYQKGNWDGLKNEMEHDRFMAIVQLTERWKPHGDLLEIGCGEALLQQKLTANSYNSLTGVDLSDVAIERAQVFANERTRYLVADMEVFKPDRVFDAIIFTESLNYAKNPLSLLKRYQTYLKPDGVFIISMYDNKQIPQIWQSLAAAFEVIDALQTSNERGRWDCKVLR
ncbi:MAG: class I SAM-dependent methyltransferase [Spirosomataceae bacterium]